MSTIAPSFLRFKSWSVKLIIVPISLKYRSKKIILALLSHFNSPYTNIEQIFKSSMSQGVDFGHPRKLDRLLKCNSNKTVATKYIT